MTAPLARAQVAGPIGQGTNVLEGTVRDDATGEWLPGATVQIEGTYTGTVTNSEGVFALAARSLPTVLEVRFIGYETERVRVSENETGLLDIRLRQASIELPELVVSSEDPAVGIMRRVIRRKAEQKEMLESYAVDAYNRFRVENDTGIVSIWESFTEAWWHRDRGIREVSVWQEQTRNADLDDALPAAIFVVNLSDDDIDVAGHRLMGVTHPRALSMYDFRLDTMRAMDSRIVYDILVAPKSNRGSGFVGRIAVLDEEWVMIHARLSPGASFLFPPPIEEIDVTYEQQFSRFSGEYWLPASLASDINVRIGLGRMLTLPEIRIRQLSRLTDFRINVPVPDSLYGQEDLVVVDTTRMEKMRPAALIAVPLTPEEESAYATLDSTVTMEDAFQPGGILGRLSRAGGDSDDTGGPSIGGRGMFSAISVRPGFWYNRVQGLHSEAQVDVDLPRDVQMAATIGYDGASREWTKRAMLAVGHRVRWQAEVFDDVDVRVRSLMKSQLLNSLTVVAGDPDYFDYVSRRGVATGVRLEIPGSWWVESGLDHTEYGSVPVRVQDTFLGTDVDQVPNVAIDEGTLTRVRIGLGREWAFVPFGIGGSRRAEADVEVGLGGSMPDSDSYVRATAEVYWRVPTFNRRRLLPQALDLRIMGGIMSRRTPSVRYGLVDGSSRFMEFGALRTREDRPYEGTRYGLVAWEHTLRTIPFEMLGWGWAVERQWNVVVHGAHGAAWAPRTDAAAPGAQAGGHHEVGVSLSGLFTLFRIDGAWRLDERDFRAGISFARIF